MKVIKAFPMEYFDSHQSGMDLRDYFAGQAIPALVINKEVHKVIFSIASQENETPEHCLAVMAYHIADEMMKARAA
jgi:ATP sulfurylase